MDGLEHLDPSQMTDDEYKSQVLSLQTVPPELSSVYGAGFWHRALARLIDTILHYVAGIIAGIATLLVLFVYAVIMNKDFYTYKENIGNVETTLTLYLSSLAGAILYQSISEGLNGASLGKRLCGLVVISEKQTLCSFKSAVGRSAAFFIDGLFFGVIGAIHMSKTQLRQRLGDKWNHTIVCRRKDVSQHILVPKRGFFIAFLLAFAFDVVLISIGILIAI